MILMIQSSCIVIEDFYCNILLNSMKLHHMFKTFYHVYGLMFLQLIQKLFLHYCTLIYRANVQWWCEFATYEHKLHTNDLHLHLYLGFLLMRMRYLYLLIGQYSAYVCAVYLGHVGSKEVPAVYPRHPLVAIQTNYRILMAQSTMIIGKKQGEIRSEGFVPM